MPVFWDSPRFLLKFGVIRTPCIWVSLIYPGCSGGWEGFSQVGHSVVPKVHLGSKDSGPGWFPDLQPVALAAIDLCNERALPWGYSQAESYRASLLLTQSIRLLSRAPGGMLSVLHLCRFLLEQSHQDHWGPGTFNQHKQTYVYQMWVCPSSSPLTMKWDLIFNLQRKELKFSKVREHV